MRTGVFCGLMAAIAVPVVHGLPVVLYQTGFEPPTYESGFTLDGQGGWLASPAQTAAGSQIVTNALPGRGQQAIIGFVPPTGTTIETVSAYRPLNVDPVADGRPWVGFTVTLAFSDSTTTNRDGFRWSVYNRTAGGERLFSIEFDNQTQLIWFLLDNDQFESTGRSFERDGLYDLSVTMNLASNVWSAALNGELFVNAAPMTTVQGRKLDLGDIDAVWVLGVGNQRFGDNYMIFDDYRVVADTSRPLPCQVQPVQFLENGDLLLRLIGEPGRTYAVETSPDLRLWTPLATNTPDDGTFVTPDPGALARAHRFYRGRAVWP